MAWDTVIVACLGIAGTVTAAAVSPFAAARLARRDRRADIYADTLALLWVVQDNALTLSAMPGAELPAPPLEELRRLDARARLVAGDRVVEQLRLVVRLANRFERDLFVPQLRQRSLRQEQERNPDAPADTATAIQERMSLGEIADDLAAAIVELEQRMRVEVA